jgi:hypothetical protein
VALANQYRSRGRLQRLDTHQVLDWDGPVLSQEVSGLSLEFRYCPKAEVSALRAPCNYDPGLGPLPSLRRLLMRFYKNPDHRFYAGVDLHARSLFVCIFDPATY